MPIDFPSSPSSGQRYNYLSKSWIWNNVYWASVGSSGNISSGQLGTPVLFSGNIASGSIGSFHFASGVVGGGFLVTSGLIGNNAVASENIASGQVGRFQINDFNPGTNLPLGKGGNKGYFAGGASTGSVVVTTADKLTFSTDTTAAQTSANLSQARARLAGCSGEGTNGYFAGGITGGFGEATADRITFFTDTTIAQTSANLSQGRYELAGISQGTTKGYFAGGTTDNANPLTTADKLTYSTNTTVAQTTANLSQAKYGLAGCSGEGTKGYFNGGTTSSNAVTFATTADKLTYSTDTTVAQTTANLSQGRYAPAGISQGTTKGYFAGGSTSASTSVATADKLTYSTDTTTAQTSANLSQARYELAGISEGLTKGYFAGGATATFTTRTVVVDKLTYSSDTTAAQTTANLSQARYFLAGVGQEYNIGVFFGNNSITSGNIASGQIGQYHFSSGTINNAANPVTSIFGLTKGYFAGGITDFLSSSVAATTDKLVYSTDTTTAQSSANLSQARGRLAGCSGDSTKGYFAGGYTGGVFALATADKLTYSSDATAAQTTANLSQARYFSAGVSEGTTKGYLAGGSTGAVVSTADKLTYSTDTTTTQTSANLSQARYTASVDGTSTKGYFAGGVADEDLQTVVATADKLTYSTDTTAAQTSANLSQARGYLAGVSEESTKGYFAGGFTGGYVSTADKLIYSTDTTAAQTTADLSQARYGLAGASERITKGYFAGGTTGSFVTTADKLTFATDTTAAQNTANLSQARNFLAGVGQGGNSFLNPILNSGVFGDSAVNSGNISSGQISTFHLSDQSISSGVIVSGIISRFKLSDQAIYSGAIASGQIPIFSLSSGLLISSSFGNGSVGSGQILASSAINSGGKIDSPHIASGEINSFNIASGTVNASSRLGSQSVFNLQPASIAAGASLIYPASIWTTNLAFNSILSGGISTGIIGNTKISDQGVGSGAIASGQIFRFHTSSGFINSGHFGDAALSSGSFNFGCVDGNSLTSGLWAVPYSQLVSGGIIAGYFDNNSINNNAFQYIQSYVNAGYFAGGTTGGVSLTTADKLIYSTDTTSAQTSANLSQERCDLAGCSGEGTKGYFNGGQTSTIVGTADKLTYSTAAAAAQASANLTQARYALAGISERSTKGYFAGGSSTGSVVVTTADKLTYSSDATAAQTTANLSQARFYLAGVSGNSTKGYFAGGITGSTYQSTADKLTYANDITTAQTTANLSQARGFLAGCSGDSTKGYFAGGFTGAVALATADKLTYSTDTTSAQTTANLSQARYGLAGISELSTKGYLAGGNDLNNYVSTADKLTYSTDTTAAQTSANLSQARGYLAGVDGGSSPIFSYNQVVTSGKITTTAANKIIAASFADNSVVSGNINAGSIFSVIGGYTPFTRWFNATRRAAVNSGHIPSGEIGPSHFARETLISGNFSSGLFRLQDLLGDPIRSGNIGDRQIGQIHFGGAGAGGTTRGGNQGYILGGYSTNYTSRADKTTYASDTTASQTTANLTTSTAFSAGVSEGSTKGYVAGGDTTSYVVTAYKTTFATDSTATQSSANLSQARTYLAGCSGEGTKGYFAGGSTAGGLTGTSVATANKIIYSTDTTTAQTSANLSQARSSLAGITEGSTKGYLLGGQAGVNQVTTADKITFATDVTAAQTSANLLNPTFGAAGNSGDSTKGYVSGQGLGATITRKITYATDTTTAQSSANLTSAKYWATGITQGSTKGYVAGGFDDYNPQNTADKITFSSDTTAAQTTANLSQARYGAAGLEQYLTATAGSPTFVVTSSMVASGQIDPSINFAQTAGLNTNQPLFDFFVFQEQCSGIKAVCIASGSRIVRAQRASGLRLPAIGVTNGNVSSGSVGLVYYLGGVGRTTTLAQNSGLNNGISGFQGLPLYVGSGGNIINLSGMLGTSSGAAFLSGDMQQQIGIAISGGIFVMPSPRVNRSGFQGTLPYNI
jgi:hypothetical protein